ncbi:MAG: acetyl-CoA carboxylase biotin carboxyl carrier protein [Rubrimonas sp.]|uniref:acetyl-CoA carboxylase biotin carboxyl carrier protein n=1 Tax=Rubrimonas sp. TaxID=2036015 RepID=UPI002FDCBE0F
MSTTTEEDIAFIQALAALLRESDLSELEVSRATGETGELKVRLQRGGAPMLHAPVFTHAPHPHLAPAPPAQAPAAPGPEPVAAAAPEDPASHPGAVTSPMVGTAYMSPEPSAPAYVKVGDTVKEGQTLLIIEAMKTMNQIPSPRSGTVLRILIEDKQPVEFGAPLMIIA